MSRDLKFSQDLIQLRRVKVLELIAQALPQIEIANRLGVSSATISLDIQYLRCAAQEKLKTHIEERILMQYEECNTGLRLILRKAHGIINNNSNRPQDQLNAMGLAADIYSKLMDLSTNGAILEKTTKWIAEQKNSKPTEEEEQQQLEEHFGGNRISYNVTEDSEDFQDDEIEQDENESLQED